MHTRSAHTHTTLQQKKEKSLDRSRYLSRMAALLSRRKLLSMENHGRKS